MGAAAAPGSRPRVLGVLAYRSETARGVALRGEGFQAATEPLTVSLERSGPHAAKFALDKVGAARVRRDKVARGGPIKASWRRFRGHVKVGTSFAKFAALAEQVVPFMDRNLDATLPTSMIVAPGVIRRSFQRESQTVERTAFPRHFFKSTAQVAPYEEARDVDDFSLRGTTAQSGTHVLPIEYRGLVLGPLVLGTYGFTKNVLVNKEQKGCWYAALPHAPNHFSREAPFAPARLRHGGVATFAGAAITTADGALSDIEGKYLHLAKCLPAAASLRQLGSEPESRVKEFGHWAAATLVLRGVGSRALSVRGDRTMFDQACAATLNVRVTRDGAATWSHAKLKGKCLDCDGARRWTFDGPQWDADAPDPLAAAPGLLSGPFAWLADAREADTFAWPDDVAPARADSLQLQGEFVSGVFVLTASMAGGRPQRKFRVAVFALSECGES